MSDAAQPSASLTPAIPSSKLFDLTGRHAILTGGTRGIGAACALALAQSGATVCLIVRPGGGAAPSGAAGSEHVEADGTRTHPALAPLFSASATLGLTPEQAGHCIVEADLSDMQSVKSAIPNALKIPSLKNRIDILVNCGGIQRRHPAEKFPEEDWDEVLNVNLKSVFLLCQAAGAHMLSRGQGGKIVNFGSLLSYQGGLTVPAYAASKGAVMQMTKALSNEWSKHSIQVNGIAPGYIATDMNEKLLADPVRLRQISERIPSNRWGQAEDMVGPLIFLCSSASQYVSGEMVVVDGGWMGR